MGLFASMVGSAGLALIPGFHILWALNVVIDVCFAGYVTLLLRAQAGAPVRAVRTAPTPIDDEGGYDLAFAYAHAAND